MFLTAPLSLSDVVADGFLTQAGFDDALKQRGTVTKTEFNPRLDGYEVVLTTDDNKTELSLTYYRSMGYHPEAVREYLLTILNSDFEEWRGENPNSPLEDFQFSTDKMSGSGALFDLNKLNDTSKIGRASCRERV